MSERLHVKGFFFYRLVLWLSHSTVLTWYRQIILVDMLILIEQILNGENCPNQDGVPFDVTPRGFPFITVASPVGLNSTSTSEESTFPEEQKMDKISPQSGLKFVNFLKYTL